MGNDATIKEVPSDDNSSNVSLKKFHHHLWVPFLINVFLQLRVLLTAELHFD